VLIAKYALSGNGLLLADTIYLSIEYMSSEVYPNAVREFTYGSKGLSSITYKRYKADGSVDDTYDDYNYTDTYTYSGNTISEKTSRGKWEYVYYMENGKIVRAVDLIDSDDESDKFYYNGNDCIKVESFKGARLVATQTNEFDDKKNPFYNNWFAFYDEALGEHNLKKATDTYPDGSSPYVDTNIEYLTYNGQDYPTKYEVVSYGTTVYSYEYIGW